MNLQRILASLFITLFGTSAAHAATFCVGTGQQLQVALNTAGSNNQNDTIRITSGTKIFANPNGYPYIWEYTPDGFEEYDNTLNISGGWNSNCSTYSIGAQHTILDGQNLNATVLEIVLQTDAGVSISNLSIVRAGGVSSIQMNGPDGNWTADFSLDTVQVVGGTGNVALVGGRIDVTNFLVTGVIGSGGDLVRIAPSIAGSKVAFTSVYNNVLDATTAYALNLKGISRIVNVAAFANVLNTGTAVKDANVAIMPFALLPTIENNHFQNYTADTVSQNRMSNTTFGPTETDSVVIGSFTAQQPRFGALQNTALTIDPMPARDIYGRARITQWAPDRGAVESTYCRLPTIPGLQEYFIAERQPNGALWSVDQFVGLVQANTWGTRTLTVTGGSGAGIFSLNDDGTLSLTNPSLLDYELATNHTLTVSVSDHCGNGPFTGTVKVYVSNYTGDDGAPLFVSSFE